MATFLTGIKIYTSNSSRLNNQISNGTEVILFGKKICLNKYYILTPCLPHQNINLYLKIRFQIKEKTIYTKSIKIILTKICVKEEVKTTEMLFLLMKKLPALKIRELFLKEITTTSTQKMEVI